MLKRLSIQWQWPLQWVTGLTLAWLLMNGLTIIGDSGMATAYGQAFPAKLNTLRASQEQLTGNPCRRNLKDDPRQIRFYYQYGRMLRKQGRFKDALSCFEKSAQRDYAPAQNQLAIMYANGEGGLEQSYSLALEWFLKSGNQGFGPAENNLGILYAKGNDFDRALKWYQRAAEHGEPKAMDDLGTLYQFGRGVIKDYQQAYYWYAQAADLGYANAQNNLAILYYNGKGTPKDDLKAFSWFKQAALQGHPQAQRNLAQMYELGIGVSPNIDAAVSWYQKAADQGNAYALSRLPEIKIFLTLPVLKGWEEAHFEMSRDDLLATFPTAEPVTPDKDNPNNSSPTNPLVGLAYTMSDYGWHGLPFQVNFFLGNVTGSLRKIQLMAKAPHGQAGFRDQCYTVQTYLNQEYGKPNNTVPFPATAAFGESRSTYQLQKGLVRWLYRRDQIHLAQSRQVCEVVFQQRFDDTQEKPSNVVNRNQSLEDGLEPGPKSPDDETGVNSSPNRPAPHDGSDLSQQPQ